MAAQKLINKDDPNNRSRNPEIRALLDTHACEVLRPQSVKGRARRPPRSRLPSREGETPSRRKQRRVEYARIQELFKADRNRCTQVVLNGHWRYDSLTASPAVSKESRKRTGRDCLHSLAFQMSDLSTL